MQEGHVQKLRGSRRTDLEIQTAAGDALRRAGILGSFLAMGALFALLSGCGRPATDAGAAGGSEGAITNYDARGVVLSLQPEKKTVVIRHEEIPGYMMAMTMPLEVRDTNELASLHPGDGIRFRMRVTETDGWIDQIQVTSNAMVTTAPTNAALPGFRVLPNVPDLNLGDTVPNYTFTNQLGKRFDLDGFRGQALAVTFVFTRCPYPLFCPRVTEHFGQVQQTMRAATSGPTNWHLLTLTFDPDYDTPETMRAYGARWKADAAHWTLATGAMEQIEPLGVSVGLYFSRNVPVGEVNHNLRTLVIAPDGRLVKVYPGNEWTPAELVADLTQAAAGK
ncbi:MAG: SCO family protein [Verrucomicrobiae bacterium]|nr:SCO family protein [Verrucomicrobiae bacterium]